MRRAWRGEYVGEVGIKAGLCRQSAVGSVIGNFAGERLTRTLVTLVVDSGESRVGKKTKTSWRPSLLEVTHTLHIDRNRGAVPGIEPYSDNWKAGAPR